MTLQPTAREAAEVHVYPNPSTGTAVTRLALRGLTNQVLDVRVTDLLGRVVSTQRDSYQLPGRRAAYAADGAGAGRLQRDAARERATLDHPPGACTTVAAGIINERLRPVGWGLFWYCTLHQLDYRWLG